MIDGMRRVKNLMEKEKEKEKDGVVFFQSLGISSFLLYDHLS